MKGPNRLWCRRSSDSVTFLLRSNMTFFSAVRVSHVFLHVWMCEKWAVWGLIRDEGYMESRCHSFFLCGLIPCTVFSTTIISTKPEGKLQHKTHWYYTSVEVTASTEMGIKGSFNSRGHFQFLSDRNIFCVGSSILFLFFNHFLDHLFCPVKSKIRNIKLHSLNLSKSN